MTSVPPPPPSHERARSDTAAIHPVQRRYPHGAVTGREVRVGVALGSRFTIEGGALLARRELAFRITGDRESSAQQFDGETVHHYVFDAGLQWELPVARGPRLRTFAGGGAGYSGSCTRIARSSKRDRSTMWAVVLDIGCAAGPNQRDPWACAETFD